MHRHINVFEKLAGMNPAHTFAGLDEVVAGVAGLFAAEGVGKDERFGKLTGVHEETRAVNGPWSLDTHKNSTPGGRAVVSFSLLVSGFVLAVQSVAQMFCGRSRPRGAGSFGAK